MTETPQTEVYSIASTLVELFGLAGKIAVVTGGANGIGYATAELLARSGATVLAADIQGAERAGSPGVNVHAVTVDVTSERSVIDLFKTTASMFGRVDILVNAATESFNRPLVETVLEDWNRVHDVNLRGAFLSMRETIPLMLAGGRGGRIVNVTTIGGKHPVLDGNGAYSSAKAGLNMLTLNVALDYAAAGITVNAVLPGAIVTEQAKRAVSARRPTGPASDRARQLSGYGSANDAASAILYLVSDAARYVTGQQLAVDGGFLIS